MKNKRIISIIITLLIITLISSVGFTKVLATENVSNELVNEVASQDDVAKTQGSTTTGTTNTSSTTNIGDVYALDEVVTFENDVDGNLFIMGKDIMINNVTVNGDIFVMGLNVTIDDTVTTGSIFALGQNISLTGESRSAQIYACGQNITLGQNSVIQNDARITGSKVVIDSIVGHNAYVGCDTFELNGRINGDLEYSATEESEILDDNVHGNVTYVEVEEPMVQENTIGEKIFDTIKKYAKTFFSILLVGLVFVFVDKKFLRTIYKSTNGEVIGKSLLFMLLGICVVPIASLILALTGIGASAGLALLYALVLACIVSMPAGVTAITGMMCRKKLSEESKANRKAAYGRLVLVALVFSLIAIIPILGSIAKLCAIVLGLGAIIRNIFYKDEI